MKVEVVYCSKTGNTEKVARAIASVFDVEAKNLKKEITVKDFDLLFAGSGVYGGKPGKQVVEFIDILKDVKGKKVALFGTYGESLEPIESLGTNLEKKGMKIIGSWGCRRKFLIFGRNKPSDNDLKNAKEWAKELNSRKDPKIP